MYELSCLLPPESVDDDDDDSDFVLLDDDRLLKANPFPNKLIFLISFCGDWELDDVEQVCKVISGSSRNVKLMIMLVVECTQNCKIPDNLY